MRPSLEKRTEKNLIEVFPKTRNISWEEITSLLHLSYSKWSEKGLVYVASKQPVEQTINRIGDGVCLVATLNGQLAGTVSFKKGVKPRGRNKWYMDCRYMRPFQFAVHPSFMNMGLGKVLWAAMEEAALIDRIDSILVDTAAEALWLGKWYERLGYLKVDYVSHASTNYYSIVYRKAIFGKEYSSFYRVNRFFYQKLSVYY